MIVRETATHYVLIRQHDHGVLAGNLAYHWGNPPFFPLPYELTVAAALHDFSWIDADAKIPWNVAEDRPWNFTDLPANERFPAYQNGLNKLEKINAYSALLASLHYCSFIDSKKGSPDPAAIRFLQKERKRQSRLKKRHPHFRKNLMVRLAYLQLMDHLSLYCCLNKPGTPKNEEHPWYRDGFSVPIKNDRRIHLNARWKNDSTIALDPFPFHRPFSTLIPYMLCRKTLGKKDPDLEKIHYQPLTFVPVNC